MIPASTPIPGSYDYSEVARSVFIAVAASYAALDLSGRVTAAQGRVRLAWLGGGAAAMGIGIWEMHLKGMLACRLPVPVEYHWPTLLAALLVAVLASAVALYVTGLQKMGPVEAFTGCVTMGGGIAGLHYICMAAMRLPAIARFSPLAGSLLHPARNFIFSNRATDGFRSTRGDEVERPAQTGQRLGDGSRYLRHALHRNGCRQFFPRPASGPLPCFEHLATGQQWNRDRDLDSNSGCYDDFVGGSAGRRRNSAH